MDSDKIKYDIDLKKLVDDSNAKLGSSGYYRLQCPLCTGSSLALSVRSNFKYGYCFRCGTIFLPNQGRLQVDIVEDLFEENQPSFIHKINSQMLSLIGDKVPSNGIDYLKSRNPHVEDWSVYRQRYEINDNYTMILTPYYFGDDLVYYQVRYQYKDGTRRFSNPKNTDKSIYLPRGKFDISLPTLICEGPFDAIAIDCVNPDVNIMSIGGSVVYPHLVSQLEYLGISEVLIWMDDEEKTNKFISDLSNKFKLQSILGIYSKTITQDGDDPEEVLNKIGVNNMKKIIEIKSKIL